MLRSCCRPPPLLPVKPPIAHFNSLLLPARKYGDCVRLLCGSDCAAPSRPGVMGAQASRQARL
jgi:hypothetical protein